MAATAVMVEGEWRACVCVAGRYDDTELTPPPPHGRMDAIANREWVRLRQSTVPGNSNVHVQYIRARARQSVSLG